MNITSNLNALHLSANYSKAVENTQKQGISLTDPLTQMREQSFSFSYVSFDIQNAAPTDNFTQEYEAFQSFLNDIGYEGSPIAELSKEEATALVAEDGFFGITKTAQRIANFVLQGAGEDEDLLRAGRQGVLQGFNEAEEMWGSKLPDISYKTIDMAVEIIDKAMHDMGYSIINEEV